MNSIELRILTLFTDFEPISKISCIVTQNNRPIWDGVRTVRLLNVWIRKQTFKVSISSCWRYVKFFLFAHTADNLYGKSTRVYTSVNQISEYPIACYITHA